MSKCLVKLSGPTFQSKFPAEISKQNFRPKFLPEISGRNFRSKFPVEISSQNFRPKFLVKMWPNLYRLPFFAENPFPATPGPGEAQKIKEIARKKNNFF